MVINKNEFFTILSKHNANMAFAKIMLDGATVPAEVRYQFDSTTEWDLSLPVVQEMLGLFVALGMVPKEAAEEINAMNQEPALDIRDKRYDIRGVTGEVVKWIEANMQPQGTPYIIEAEQVVENGVPVMLKKGTPYLRESGHLRTTGVLPAPAVEVK